MNLNQLTLIDATFLQFDHNQNLLEKYDSTYAKFEANQWILHNVWADMEGKSREYLEIHKIETNSNELLMFENAIKNSNQSIWTILGVIKKLNLNNWDGAIFAAAGIERLNFSNLNYKILIENPNFPHKLVEYYYLNFLLSFHHTI